MKALHLVRDPFFQCRGDHKWNLSFVFYRFWQSRSMALAIKVLVAIRVQTFVAKHESLVETPLFCGYEFLHAYFWCNSILLDAYFVILRKMWHISIGALQESGRCSKIFDGPEPAKREPSEILLVWVLEFNFTIPDIMFQDYCHWKEHISQNVPNKRSIRKLRLPLAPIARVLVWSWVYM